MIENNLLYSIMCFYCVKKLGDYVFCFYNVAFKKKHISKIR